MVTGGTPIFAHEGRMHLTAKTIQAFRKTFQTYPDAQWFLKADDDVYIIYPRLEQYLQKFDPRIPYYIGQWSWLKERYVLDKLKEKLKQLELNERLEETTERFNGNITKDSKEYVKGSKVKANITTSQMSKEHISQNKSEVTQRSKSKIYSRLKVTQRSKSNVHQSNSDNTNLSRSQVTHQRSRPTTQNSIAVTQKSKEVNHRPKFNLDRFKMVELKEEVSDVNSRLYRHGYNSGGAGYVLSRAAVQVLLRGNY